MENISHKAEWHYLQELTILCMTGCEVWSWLENEMAIMRRAMVRAVCHI